MNFNRETVLLTGGSGLLSINWAMTMRDKKNIILGLHNRNIDINNVTAGKINLESIEDIIKALQLFRPRTIVHTAGLTNVELCESNMDLAYHINVKLASNVAIAATHAGVKMVHISTDHLYDGTRFLVDENEPLSPKNNYGITKAKAEEAVSKANPDALIIRSNFYAWGPLYRRSFSDTIIDSLRQKKTNHLI
jgi:dTDP-4-dehydrorhamnose reductase